jgi:DNA-binding response OmpR family regulator
LKRILVVEDDRDLRFVIRMILEHAGYEVAVARNGIAALESIGAEPPDLIIADLTMPVMSGVELVDQLRANRATVSIPVVLLSGGQVDSATLQRVEAIVTKPFEPDHLLACIETALHADRGEPVT